MTLLSTATYWLNQGYATIPLVYRSKRPLIDWELYQNTLPTRLELDQWFPCSMRNIGLIVGRGLVVIDFDLQPLFDYWHKSFPIDTYMTQTSRGVHVYFHTEQQAKNYHSDLLDIKAERGYVLIPPSVHPNGHIYQALNQSPVMRIANLDQVLPREYTPEPELVPVVTQYVEPDAWDVADSAMELDGDVVGRIREQVSILHLMPEATASDRSGRWYVALCPFHEDHNPSFWIDLVRGMCGCRRCNIKEMDVINLYARLNGIDNRMAIRQLSKGV